MRNEEHLRKLERMYRDAPCNRAYAPLFMELGAGMAQVAFTVKEDFLHAAGGVHGSVIFKLLDDAAFFAVNSLITDVLALTADFHAHFLRPVTGGTLAGSGRVVQKGKTLLVAESSVVDGKGREVARGSGTFVRSLARLDERIGYR